MGTTYATYLQNLNYNHTDFQKFGYPGKYNFVLHIPSTTTFITTSKSLSPAAIVIVNDDLEVELFDGTELNGTVFNTTDKWVVYETTIKRITTNSTGEAYLLYTDNIFDIIATEGGDTGNVRIITESGIFILTESGFNLITEG